MCYFCIFHFVSYYLPNIFSRSINWKLAVWANRTHYVFSFRKWRVIWLSLFRYVNQCSGWVWTKQLFWCSDTRNSNIFLKCFIVWFHIITWVSENPCESHWEKTNKYDFSTLWEIHEAKKIRLIFWYREFNLPDVPIFNVDVLSTFFLIKIVYQYINIFIFSVRLFAKYLF